MTRIIVVRHGQTEWNRVVRFRGVIDVPLNETGLAQARAVGRRLAEKALAHGIKKVVFDRAGKYVRTLLPHDPSKAPAIRTLLREDGLRVPLLHNMRDPYPFVQLGLNRLRSSGSMVVTPGGEVLIAGPKGNRLMVLGADGSITRPLLGPAVLPDGAGGVCGLALSPDGKYLYASGPGPGGAGRRRDAHPGRGHHHPHRLRHRPHGGGQGKRPGGGL